MCLISLRDKDQNSEIGLSTEHGEHGQVVDHDICGGTYGWIKVKDKRLGLFF